MDGNIMNAVISFAPTKEFKDTADFNIGKLTREKEI
jgi:hypothetical protein